jgi:hypothetical protein
MFRYVQTGGSQCETCNIEPSGLKWRKTGTPRAQCVELENDKLSVALTGKLEFTQAEWDEFGVEDLTMKHFVKARGTYFQPAIEPMTCIFMPCEHAFCWDCTQKFQRCPECHDPDNVTAQVHAWPRLLLPP